MNTAVIPSAAVFQAEQRICGFFKQISEVNLKKATTDSSLTTPKLDPKEQRSLFGGPRGRLGAPFVQNDNGHQAMNLKLTKPEARS
jgi:hypothetical protein